MRLMEPRLGLFTGVAGLRAMVASSVWAGAPLFPIILVTQIWDNLDGWTANGGPGERTNWWKGTIGYRGRDYLFDAIMYYALFGFMAVHGVLALFFPYYLIFFFAYPVVTYLRYANPESAVGIIGPPSGLFLFSVASVALVGFNSVIAGLIALGLNPALESWIHRASWEIPDSRVGVYGGLASAIWLAVGVLVTGYWSSWLLALPIASLALGEEIARWRR